MAKHPAKPIKTVPLKADQRASNAVGPAGHNADVAQALSQILGSTYALYQKSLFYHWNVTGEHFVALHELFEQHYEELHKAGDAIAERIRALGHYAPGKLREFAELSSVAEDKKLPSNAKEMVRNLLQAHEICSKEAREVHGTAQDAEDEVTMDLMIERMGFHDKAAWMLRSLLHP